MKVGSFANGRYVDVTYSTIEAVGEEEQVNFPVAGLKFPPSFVITLENMNTSPLSK